MMTEETITITKAEYTRLYKADLFLECLTANGVDNWEWYDEAVIEYHKALKAEGLENDDD